MKPPPRGTTRKSPKRILDCFSITAGQTDNMDSTQRSACWSLTINNPTADDEEAIALARQQGWKVEGQLEVGAEGTPHYQLMLRTPQVRWSAVKKLFPRGHIEAARVPAALKKYVGKEEGRVATLSTSQEMYPSLSKFWQLIEAELDAINPYIVLAWDEVEEWSESKGEGPLPTPDEALIRATRRLIVRGYHVETIAANPATISSWRKFHVALCYRAREERRRALETEESVSVPMVNDAPQDPSPPPSPPRLSPPPPPGGWWASGS